MSHFTFHFAFWTCRASCAIKMTVRSLPKLSMFRADNANFC